MTFLRTFDSSLRPRLTLGGALLLGLLTLAGCSSLAGGNAPQAHSSDAGQTASADGPSAQAAPPPGNGTDVPVEEVPTTPPPYRPANLPQMALTPPIIYEVLAAEVALQRSQPQLAYRTYHTLALQIRDARLARRATEIALLTGAFRDALPSAKLWQELDPDSSEARQTIDTLLLATGRIQDVEPGLRQRLAEARKNGTLSLAYTQLQRQLLNANDHEQGWRAIQRLSEPDLDNAAARLARAHLAAAAGYYQVAADEAQAAHRLSPDDPEAALATAQHLQPVPDGNAQAISVLQNFLHRHPDDSAVRLALGRLQIADGQRDAAISTLHQLPEPDRNTPLALYTLAQLYFQKQDYDQAEAYLERYVGLPAEVSRDNGPAYMFLAEISEQRNDIPKAIDWLSRIHGDQSPLYFEALSRRAILSARQSRPETGLALLDTIQPRNAKEKQLIITTHAQILREAERHQEAFKLLDDALKGPDDTTDLLYDHALTAEKIGRLDLLEKSLRTLIEHRPDSGHAYNALGYTLADHNVRLPEALGLIQQADKLLPNNAHVLDSLGWVHFRMGQLPKALEILKRAYDLQPDAEIAAHYGEVLWAADRHEAAREVWRDGLKRAPDNTLLRDTLKRLDVSL
ncbi:MAG: tetratricopeptide repeat protein [Lautropia sp.]|nr:tetratricopeptide repeat protein [Lautropia sp.]